MIMIKNGTRLVSFTHYPISILYDIMLQYINVRFMNDLKITINYDDLRCILCLSPIRTVSMSLELLYL